MTRSENSASSPEKHSTLFTVFLTLIFLLPWVRGGEVYWQYSIFAMMSFLLVAYSLVSDTTIKSVKETKFAATVIKNLPFLFLTMWLFYTFMQVIPLPIELVKIVSPTRLMTAEYLSEVIDKKQNDSFVTLSISLNTSLREIIKYTSYLSIFLLACLLLNSKKRLLQLTTTIFLAASTIAVYSMIDYVTQGSASIMEPLPPWDFYLQDVIHGTFSYKNHFAAYLILAIPLGFALSYSYLIGNNKNTFLNVLNYLSSRNSILMFTSVFMMIVLMLNASRAGNGALLISLVVVITLTLLINQGKVPKKKLASKSLAFFVVLIIVFFTTAGNKLISRYLNDSDNGRQELYVTSKDIFLDYPIVGSGAGTFPNIHQQYKSSKLNGSIMWQRVHNDYLELLSTQGIIGFSLLGTATLLFYLRLLSGLRLNNRNKKRNLYSLQVACFCSVTAILIHSSADFNFQLPVIPVYFYLILAIGLKAQTLKA